MENQPKIGDSIPDDHKENRGETIEFAKKQIRDLESKNYLTSEDQEKIEGYRRAVILMEDKEKIEEKEREKLKPLKFAANGALRFSNSIKGWEAIQNEKWLKIGEEIKKAIDQNRTDQVEAGLNQWLELAHENLSKKGFEENTQAGALQKRAARDIEAFLKITDEYEAENGSVPWDKIK